MSHSRERIKNVPRNHPFAQLIRTYEKELDQRWKGWRIKKPFAHLERPLLDRVKWLLKRRMLLYGHWNKDAEEWLGCRDWGVKIVDNVKKPLMCWAHPVMPPRGGLDLDVAYFAGPQIAAASGSRGPDLALTLAKETGFPPHLVREALGELPLGYTPRLYVPRWIRQHHPNVSPTYTGV